MRRRALISALVAVPVAGLLFPSPALAHGIVGRTDLPIPVWLFGWAAAVVLVVSFVALGSLWPTARFQEEPHGRRVVALPVAVDVLLGALGVVLFGLTVYSGLAGVQDAFGNFAPTMVYVLFWVGMVVVSALFGNVFRLLSPWRAIARGVAWTARRVSKREAPPVIEYPKRLGRWPAAAGIFAFAFVELAYRGRDDPSQLATMALVYAVLMLGGMAWFGIETWSERADPFGVYFGLFARLSPFMRRDGVLYARPPLSGAPGLDIVPGTIALLCVAIGTTTFDGFSNGSVWGSLQPHIASLFDSLGAGSLNQLMWSSLLGLVFCVAVVSGFYLLGIRGMVSVGEGHNERELAGLFAHTLIPIAFAYALAHYFSLLVFQGQGAIHLFSDPLGHGSNIFGTAHTGIDYNVISSKGIWYVQVGALVVGHVCGLILAHDRAVAMYRQVGDALRSQYWMLVVMVGFTSLGLWLLSAVNA